VGLLCVRVVDIDAGAVEAEVCIGVPKVKTMLGFIKGWMPDESESIHSGPVIRELAG
jgi:hypothetical protein